MRKSETPESSSEKHSIEGHTVEIRQGEAKAQELWIDGRRRTFFLTEKGYVLPEAAYVRPTETLLDAVKSYLRKQIDKARKEQ